MDNNIITTGNFLNKRISDLASSGPNFFPGTTAGSYAQGGLYV